MTMTLPIPRGEHEMKMEEIADSSHHTMEQKGVLMQQLILSVLLDIRDVLTNPIREIPAVPGNGQFVVGPVGANTTHESKK